MTPPSSTFTASYITTVKGLLPWFLLLMFAPRILLADLKGNPFEGDHRRLNLNQLVEKACKEENLEIHNRISISP